MVAHEVAFALTSHSYLAFNAEGNVAMFSSLGKLFNRTLTSKNVRRNRLTAKPASYQSLRKFFPHINFLEMRLVASLQGSA
jgi:hypothetical protein